MFLWVSSWSVEHFENLNSVPRGRFCCLIDELVLSPKTKMWRERGRCSLYIWLPTGWNARNLAWEWWAGEAVARKIIPTTSLPLIVYGRSRSGRTAAPVLVLALQRYFEKKNLRTSWSTKYSFGLRICGRRDLESIYYITVMREEKKILLC